MSKNPSHPSMVVSLTSPRSSVPGKGMRCVASSLQEANPETIIQARKPSVFTAPGCLSFFSAPSGHARGFEKKEEKAKNKDKEEEKKRSSLLFVMDSATDVQDRYRFRQWYCVVRFLLLFSFYHPLALLIMFILGPPCWSDATFWPDPGLMSQVRGRKTGSRSKFQ